MKKLFLSLAVICFGLTSNAQEIPAKEEIKGEVSSEVSALRLASELIKYGYAQEMALPLIDAMQIIIDNPTQPLGSEKVGENVTVSSKKSGNVTLNFDEVLASAKKFAEGDDRLMALIDKVEMDSKAPSRGAVNGPKYTVDVVGPGSSDSYEVSFVANYLAEVGISGDGDTDLDLYIFDSKGNLIAADEDYTDDCYVYWFPPKTGRYQIVVVNRGRIPNKYILLTN